MSLPPSSVDPTWQWIVAWASAQCERVKAENIGKDQDLYHTAKLRGEHQAYKRLLFIDAKARERDSVA